MVMDLLVTYVYPGCVKISNVSVSSYMETNFRSKTNAKRSLLDLTNSHIMSSVYSGVEMTTETTQVYREIV